MSESAQFDDISTAISGLRAAGAVPAAAGPFAETLAAAVPELLREITRAVPAYTDSANPEVVPALEAHLGQHFDQTRRLLGGERLTDFPFVTEYAERLARQHFPLEAVLRTYRHLQKALTVRVREAALGTADSEAHVTRVVAAAAGLVSAYVGLVSAQMTTAYVEHTRRLAEAEGNRRSRLLNLLLQGYDEADRQAAQLLRRAGYLRQRQAYCVIVAQSADPVEMENPARVQRIIDSIGGALQSSAVRLLAGVRDNLATVIVSDTRRLSGWTAPQSRLADRIEPALLTLGPMVLIGVSSDQPSTAHIPKGYREAQIALEFASVAKRVVPFAKLPIRRLLIHMGGEQVQSALPSWTGDFVAANERAKGKLLATLRAYGESDMNVLKAARLLDVHPNTVYARMDRIEEVTGLDGQRFDALNELLLAAELGGQLR
jgi:sugar diacid utilization regulator